MRCQFRRPNGEQCKTTFGITQHGFCWHHCPSLDKERHRAKVQGGRARAEQQRKLRVRTVLNGEAPPPPETAADAMRWTAWATHAVATGQIDARTAREIAGNVRTFLSALEKAKLEDELKALKQAVKGLKARGH